MNFKYLFFEFAYFVLSILLIIFVYIYSGTDKYVFMIYIFSTIGFMVYNKINVQIIRKQEMEQYKKRIDILINSINAYVVIWSEDYANVIVNDRLKDLKNTMFADSDSSERELNRTFLDKIFPKNLISQSKSDMMLSSAKEFSLTLTDGKLLYLSWMSSVLNDSSNVKNIVSIGFDTTENKLIRQQLNVANNMLTSSERYYTLAMNLSEIGIILNEHCSDSFHISSELQRMLGLRENKIKTEDFIKLIHKDDRRQFELYFKTAQKNGISSTRADSMDIRILSFDRKHRWYSFRYKNIQTNRYGMPIIGGAIMDISKDKEKDLLIERMAYIDDITGVYNRNKIMLNGQEMYECCKILELSYWVIVFDIDNFHIINDTCGYVNGNKILKEFADILYKKKGKNGFAARVGADSFALIIQDYGDSLYPVIIIQEVQNEIAHLNSDHMFKQNIACSAGYSRMPDDGHDFFNVFERAEFALSTGDKRKSSVRYDMSVHDSIITAAALEKSLADAIEAGELELFYQPKISIDTRKIMGVEALIRWIKPDGEIISPDKFVPIAENSHLITKIGEYVMAEACRQNKMWQNMGFPPIIMSINLTSEDFYQKDVKQYISEILLETGLDPGWLEIELTESLAMKDIDFAVNQMRDLRDMGLKLAMDDFGTGYSSLSYIQKMPITLLKLDRSFIIMLEDDLVAQEIVSAVIKIAKSKKIKTIAEGVETEGQMKILEQLGCDYIQGFLFGKPMCAAELTEYLKKSLAEEII